MRQTWRTPQWHRFRSRLKPAGVDMPVRMDVENGVMDCEHSRIVIGGLVFPDMDQMDFTGPFEVLSRLPQARFHVVWKDPAPVRDRLGLVLMPDTLLDSAPQFDILLVPGGWGQQALMEDEVVLGFLRAQAEGARYVFSVCTGALLCGAAGLLRGVRSTTHWNSLDLLPHFGTIPVNERVVVDGKHISAAGVSAGIDGALRLAQMLCGDRVAQDIQLQMQYAPEPPFPGGTLETSPRHIVESALAAARPLHDARLATARRVARKLEIAVSS